jgi:GalNAc5-diNAcBac-PP-undecaprenol beta-1,3-glucosyltransferase
MRSPFFSIVVPCYNRAEFLPQTILSIKKQDFSDFEILLIDDGSADNTQAIVGKIAEEDRRVVYIYQQNAERGAARNNGIKNASGEYIIFLDSDDEMQKNCLQRLNEGIAQNPGYNFYAAKYDFIRNGKWFSSTMRPVKQGEYDISIVLKGNPFACNFCIKRNNPGLILFEEDRTLSTTEDWMFLIENLRHNKIFVFDFIGVSMHQHAERSMQQNQLLIKRRIKATEQVLQKIDFSESEIKSLWAYTYQFCGVHSYLDNNRKQAINFLIKAVRMQGWSKERILAFIKYMIGRSAVKQISTAFGK